MWPSKRQSYVFNEITAPPAIWRMSTLSRLKIGSPSKNNTGNLCCLLNRNNTYTRRAYLPWLERLSFLADAFKEQRFLWQMVQHLSLCCVDKLSDGIRETMFNKDAESRPEIRTLPPFRTQRGADPSKELLRPVMEGAQILLLESSFQLGLTKRKVASTKHHGFRAPMNDSRRRR